MLTQGGSLRVRPGEGGRRSQSRILAAMVETTGPTSAPSEEEILCLILEELSVECPRWVRRPLPKQST